MEKKVLIPVEIDINKNIKLEKFRIDPETDISEPPVYCMIGESPAMTAGNFSSIIGKAKSGKTFLEGAFVASFLIDKIQLNYIKGRLPSGKKTVLYFDTEQSTYHATRTIRRICKLIGVSAPKNLIAYGLRPLTPVERLAFIEEAIIEHRDNLGIVVIDGIRDLLTKGINDEEEATSLTSKFLKWTSDHDIHMILLLHQNKTDLNARGHIGTEILNKAETTLSVCKDPKSGIFVVSCEYSRDIAFDDFGFTIEDGMILPSDLPGEEQTRARNPQKISDEEHLSILDSIYKNVKQLAGADLSDQIKYGFNNVFGDNVCRTFTFHYIQKGWIEKSRENKKVFYVYKRASF